LEALSELHLEELAHLAPTMQTLLTSFVEDSADQSDPDTPPSAATH
jgi:hypothetical protein